MSSVQHSLPKLPCTAKEADAAKGSLNSQWTHCRHALEDTESHSIETWNGSNAVILPKIYSEKEQENLTEEQLLGWKKIKKNLAKAIEKGEFPLFKGSLDGDESSWLTPPAGVRLDDAAVFGVLRWTKTGRRRRGHYWPYDFDQNGFIRLERPPLGPAVVIWANGIAFAPVFGGYYALVGNQRNINMWLVSAKPKHPKSAEYSMRLLSGIAIYPAKSITADSHALTIITESFVESNSDRGVIYERKANLKAILLPYDDMEPRYISPIELRGWRAAVSSTKNSHSYSKEWCKNHQVDMKRAFSPYKRDRQVLLRQITLPESESDASEPEYLGFKDHDSEKYNTEVYKPEDNSHFNDNDFDTSDDDQKYHNLVNQIETIEESLAHTKRLKAAADAKRKAAAVAKTKAEYDADAKRKAAAGPDSFQQPAKRLHTLSKLDEDLPNFPQNSEMASSVIQSYREHRTAVQSYINGLPEKPRRKSRRSFKKVDESNPMASTDDEDMSED